MSRGWAALAFAGVAMPVRAEVPAPHVRDPEASALTWSAAPGCPDAAELADAIARAGPLPPGHRVAAEVVHAATAYELTLRIDDEPPRRIIDDDCATLARAAALVVSVRLTPLAAAATWVVPEPQRAPSPRPAARVPERTAAIASPPAPQPAVRPKIGAELAARAGLALGLTPGTTGSIGGEIAVRFARFGISVGAEHAFARRDMVGPGIGVRSQLTAGSVLFAWRPRSGAIAGELGVGAELGVMMGAGIGARVSSRQVRSPWAATKLRLGLAWPAHGRFALSLAADVLVSVRRPAIALRDRGRVSEAFRVAPVGARVLAGVLVRLPW